MASIPPEQVNEEKNETVRQINPTYFYSKYYGVEQDVLGKKYYQELNKAIDSFGEKEIIELGFQKQGDNFSNGVITLQQSQPEKITENFWRGNYFTEIGGQKYYFGVSEHIEQFLNLLPEILEYHNKL